MNDYKDLERGTRVNQFLQSDEWREAWSAYEQRIVAAIVDPKSSVDDVDHQRKLLWSAKAARQHLETLVNQGKVAAATINLEAERESAVQRVMRRWTR